MKKRFLYVVSLFSLITLSACNSSVDNPTVDKTMPTLKSVFKTIKNSENYTVRIKSYVTSINYDATKSVTNKAIYYKDNINKTEYGFINDSKGFYSFTKDDKDNVVPGYTYDETTAYYQDSFFTLRSINLDYLPSEFYKNRENYYEITDDGLIEQFSLFTDLFSSNNDLESIVPVSCAAKVIEKDAVTVDVTYSYESSLIGKVSLEFTNVGTTEISGVNDYISSNKGAKVMDPKLKKIQNLFANRNYTEHYEEDSSTYVNTYFNNNYLYREYSDNLLHTDNGTFYNEGLIEFKDKESFKDGIYSYQIKENKVSDVTKYNTKATSIFDLTLTPDFFSYYQVIKTFNENTDNAYPCDFYSTDSGVLSLASAFDTSGVSTSEGVTLFGTGLSIKDSSINSDVEISFYIFLTYNNKATYIEYTFSNFGNTNVDFIENYIDSVK